MREGETVHPSPGESITCIRSAEAGGPFVFELILEPGTGGPPTHTHDEGDETIEILEGEMAFRISGVERRLAPGDVLTLTPADPHTFWNPSKTSRTRARVTHGLRFERLVAQPDLLTLSIYLVEVDPGASRTHGVAMRAFLRVVAWIGRLSGRRPVLFGG